MSRKTFIWKTSINFAALFIIILINLIGIPKLPLSENLLEIIQIIIFVIASIATLINEALDTAKRLHDVNLSAREGWKFAIPIYGYVLWIALFFEKGTVGSNVYGDDPLT